MKFNYTILLGALLLSACGDDEEAKDQPGTDMGDAGAGEMESDGGSEAQDGGTDGPADLSGKPSFAVTLSDYESAGVALIDGEGEVLDEKFISSGSEVPGLSSALHGDIALPTQPCEAGVLTVVARSGGDYVLQVDLESGEVVHQVSTQGATGGAAYSSNPQDILCLGDGKALVSRFEPSFDPKAAELDKGDDLIRIDLESDKILSRIDLSKLRGKADGFDADGKPEEQVAYARPGSVVRIGEYAVVGLSRLTASFTAADGLLAIVKLSDDSVASAPLPEFKNCGSVLPVSGREDAVIVGCSGSPFADPMTSGFLLVSLDAEGKVSIEQSFKAKAKDPVIYAGAVSLGGTRMLGIATGDFTAGSPDTAYVLDLATGETSAVFSSALAGELGGGAFRAETGLLLVPDAGKGVRTFKVAADKLEAGEILDVPAALPARSARPLVAL